ncbi:MAG: hypothetical protein FDZ70_06855 [Actinobacteria bacterium]|nr:MAG: hypothetical protein FDZ70_06855 [Actinomycetota bacterium]
MSDHTDSWRVDEAALDGVTPLRARDLLVDCFFSAQNAAHARTKHVPHSDISRAEVRKTVEVLIRAKFRELGCDWEDPTAADLHKVALSLAVEAASWGTPPETIERAMAELRKVQQRMLQ